MRKSDNISIPAFKAPKGWHITPKKVIKPKNKKLIAFRLPEELIKKVEGFAEKLELEYLPTQGKGYISLAIRLLIEDSLNRYMGPKNDPDELVCPFADEMSEILPVLKNIKMRTKLEEMPEDISHNKKEIDKIIKKYS